MLHDDFEANFTKCPEVMKYLKEVKKQYESQIINDGGAIVKLLKKLRERGGWSSKDERIVSSITTASHKKYMKETMDYLQVAFQFAVWANSFAGNKPFKVAYDNILEAMKQLSEENADYSVKLKSIINILEQRKG